ncbi:MAG TPA: hypothetical protein VG735_09085 [Caulobacterales bacterium]|jgi:hypothetical protein|nr:hypothetical protein [Caulobacterales bacterium]
MGAVLKIFAYLGSAIGAVVWLGGTALVAFALTSTLGSSPDSATALAKLIVVIAGVVVALVASVVLLRVTRNLIWFFVCFACGAFAALAGAGFSPASLSGEASLFAMGALAILAVSVIVLAVTKRMVPFLVCLGLLGLVGVGGAVLLGRGAPGAPMEAQDASPPEIGASAPAETPMPSPPPAAAGQGAPPPVAADILPGAGAPATESAARADAEKAVRARSEEEIGLAAKKPRVASRSMRPPSDLAAAAPAPPPPAAAADPLDQPSGSGAVAAATAPPPAAAGEPAPVVADVKPSDFQTAELKFNKPEKMEIDVAYTVSATIAGALAETQATLGNVGPTVTRDVKITRKVRVELVADDFDIKKLHTIDTVLITPETSGQWSWQVTPRRLGGDRKMLLQVYGVIERDGVSQGETLIKTYEETISVQVTPMARVRLISQGIVERWQPIAGALGVIGGIWVFLQKLLGALTRRRKIEVAN